MEKQELELRLLSLLNKHNLSVATAESCTGGLVAARLCDISGISRAMPHRAAAGPGKVAK